MRRYVELGVRLDEEPMLALDAIAKARRLPRAVLLREAVDAVIARRLPELEDLPSLREPTARDFREAARHLLIVQPGVARMLARMADAEERRG